MNSISKVSDITTNDLAEYIRLVEVSEDDENTLSNLLEIAKTFISNYTGQADLDLKISLIPQIYHFYLQYIYNK